MFFSLSLSFILVSLFFVCAPGFATEEFAEKTGTDCVLCHVDSLGGGELTELGRGYLLSVDGRASSGEASRKTFRRIIKLLFLYTHIVFAFLWFGTILYVHLVLKPAYASQGLPRGEVRVGLVSMAVLAVTGAVLTYYKVPSFSLLVASRFGVLLVAKISIFLIMAVSALYVVFVIGPKLKKRGRIQEISSAEMTAAELANFDGDEGRPAYIAFQGKIYDVSRSRLWKEGNHMARHHAGADLTDMLSQAPHGEEKILAMPEVGSLSPKKSPRPGDLQKRVFFFMAYMNLGFVFLVTLILALWRW